MLRLNYTYHDAPQWVDVQFEYTRFNPDDPQAPRDTLCFIAKPDGTMKTGSAQLHHLDHFNRVVGRKIAFGRALKNITQDPSERREVWNAYFGLVNYR